MAREIGISDLTFFPLTTDEAGQDPVYGAAFAVPWAVNFTTDAEYSEAEYYADNIIENSMKQLSKYSVTMEVSSNTPPALDAKITGKTVVAGGSVTGSDTLAPKHAIAYEIKMDDGSTRRKVIYKVTLDRTSTENSTQEESIEGKTYSYEGTATPLVGIKQIELILDSKEIDAIQNQQDKAKAQAAWDAFFTDVALPSAWN